MLARYQRGWLRSDLVAGVVLAAILVPQGMAYAELAGLPAVNGLYTTIACLVGYALLRPVADSGLGPDSSLGPLIFAAIVPLSVTGDPAELVAFAGHARASRRGDRDRAGAREARVRRRPALEGSSGRLHDRPGITIIVGQLPKLFGFSTDADGFVDEVRAFFDGIDARNRDTLIVGLASLALMLILPRFTSRLPAVLITVVLSTLAVSLFDLTAHGVTTVGSLPQGLPRPQLPSVDLSDIGALLAAR